PLAVEVAVRPEPHDLVACVVADRNRERDRVGDVEPAVGIDVESRLGTHAGAYRVPPADRPAARIARHGPVYLLHDAVLLLDRAALGRELVDGPHRLAVGLVLLETCRRLVVLRHAPLQQIDVARAIDPEAAAVARHARDRGGNLALLAVADG